MWLMVFQRILLDALLDILYFPLWWYSGGLWHAAKWCVGLFQYGNMSLAPGLWLKNIFVPMFGQYDWQGRIISFFMRLIQLIFRSIASFVWMLICFVIFFIWIILPVVVFSGLFSSIIS